ncbi:MAG: DUF885 domain-containing protein [Ruminococcus sp.]|jgi:hypothetical protein|nr:DUF885 domain-containing protein [Ruminococcus sp.]
MKKFLSTVLSVIIICFVLPLNISAENEADKQFIELFNERLALDATVYYPTYMQLYFFKDPVKYGVENTFDGFYGNYPKSLDEIEVIADELDAKLKSLDSSAMSEQYAYLHKALIDIYNEEENDEDTDEGYEETVESVINIPHFMLGTDLSSDLHFEGYTAILEDFGSWADEYEKVLSESSEGSDTYLFYAEIARQVAADENRPILKIITDNIDNYGGDKEALIARANTAYEEEFIPAYESVAELLEAAAEEAVEAPPTLGIGVNYEEFWAEELELEASPDEVFEFLTEYYFSIAARVEEIRNGPDFWDKVDKMSATDYTGDEIFEMIYEKYGDVYPISPEDLPETGFMPSYLGSGASGRCFPPRIDDPFTSRFFLTEGLFENNSTGFLTIAHEGYPGHYYDSYHLGKLFPNTDLPFHFRDMMLGEGWADYTGLLALGAIYEDSEIAEYAALSNILAQIDSAVFELGLYHCKWTFDEFKAFYETLPGFGEFTEEDYLGFKSFYESSIYSQVPYTYAPLKLFEMRQKLIDRGDFDELSFHTFILDHSYMTFEDAQELFYETYFPENAEETPNPETGNSNGYAVLIVLTTAAMILSRRRR